MAALQRESRRCSRRQKLRPWSYGRRRGISVEQLLAAAITEAVREKLSTFRYPPETNAVGPDYFSYTIFGGASTPPDARRKNNKRAAKR
jgi:hypothetical protein